MRGPFWTPITPLRGPFCTPIHKSVADNVEKGQKVMITGRIHYTRWTDQQDIERFGVEIIADEVTFLSYGKSRQQQQAGSQDNEEEDIPF